MGSPISTRKSSGIRNVPFTSHDTRCCSRAGTGTDPGLPFCALTTRSSNVTQLFHLLTKPLLIITSVPFPRESSSLSGSCSVTGSPKCLWERWTERSTTAGPRHTDGSSLCLVKCPAHYTHPLWTGSWGEGTDFFLKPQHVTGFKQPFCSSVHAAHVTPTTCGRNGLHFKGKYYLLLWKPCRLSKGTFFQKQVSVTKLDLPQLGLLTQTLPFPVSGISDSSQGSLPLLFAFLIPSLFSTCFSPNPALSPFLVSSPPFFTVISIFFEMFWHLMLALFFLLHLLLLSF